MKMEDVICFLVQEILSSIVMSYLMSWIEMPMRAVLCDPDVICMEKKPRYDLDMASEFPA